MTARLELDHIVVSAKTLAEGTAHVENALGVTLSEIGHHERMGTHNRLLSLGPDAYLEVIAIDPTAAPPPHPRWFDLDSFDGPPRITNWVCRTDDLDTLLADAPADTGTPMAFARGDFRWRMAVPEDGKLPFDGAMPALIQWETDAHPAPRLPDVGVRLRRFEIRHPEIESFVPDFMKLTELPNLAMVPSSDMGFLAVLDAPTLGIRVLR